MARSVHRGSRPRKHLGLGVDVWNAALDRVRRAYQMFDHIAVAFSGGKDSTATLHATLEVAHELGRTPVTAVFCDEEAIPWETVEYVERVGAWPDVDLRWLCLPFTLRNACSRKHPDWWTWEPESQDRWARPLPVNPWVITEMPGVSDRPRGKRPDFPSSFWRQFNPADGTLGVMLGIRAQESAVRQRNLTNRVYDNYICPYPKEHDPHGFVYKVQPVYDWTTEDVWTAPALFGWDHNYAYDVMEMMGVGHAAQRCSPAFGEEPLEKLHTYAECFPDVWDRMQERVPGVGAAYRYARTMLYGYQGHPIKPTDMAWGDWITYWVNKHSPESATSIADRVKQLVSQHYNKTREPILPRSGHPETGVSWEFLVTIAMRGDMKQRKQPGMRAKTREQYDAELAALRAEGRFKESTSW